MAFTRKFLSALGIDDDKVDEIIQAHTEVTNGLKEERDRYKGEAEANEKASEALKKAQKELDELKADGNPFETKYNELKDEFDTFKSGVEAKELTEKKKDAFRQLLKDAGISEKRINTVVKASPKAIDDIDFEDDGKVKDADKLCDSLKNEWQDFIVKSDTKGAETATPPANNGGGGMTKEQIMAIKDRAKRREAIAQNPEAFGIDVSD